MKYPLTSFLTSLLIWAIIFFTFSWWVFPKNHQKVKAINIDANLIEPVKSVTENQKNSLPKRVEEKQISDKLPEKPTVKPKEGTGSYGINSQNQIATPTYQPLPQIPDELRREAYYSYAIARFHIAADGTFTVKLIKPCNNPTLNYLLLQSLKKWQFLPEKRWGVFVSSTKDIRVGFKVE